MPAETLPRIDHQPAGPPRREPNASAQTSQAVLIPFLAELADVDARMRTERQASREKHESLRPEEDESGLAAVDAAMRERAESAERDLESPSRAARRHETMSELRQRFAQEQQGANKASGDKAEKQQAPPRVASESAPKSGSDPQTSPAREPSQSNAAPSRDADKATTRNTPNPPSSAAPGQPNTSFQSESRASTSRDAAAQAGQQSRPTATPVQAMPAVTASSAAIEKTVEAASTDRSAAAAKPVAEARADVARIASGKAAVEFEPSQPARRPASETRANRPSAAGGAGPETGKNDVDIKQILRVIRSRIGRNDSQIVLRLDPPALGSIRIHMELREQELQLRLDTETHLAQRLLSGKVEALREALEASGIRLERFEVRPQSAAAELPDFGREPQSDAQQTNDGSAHTNAERSGGQRESESHRSATATEEPAAEQLERPAETALNVLA